MMIADAATGAILRYLATAPENVADNIGDGEIAIDGRCPLDGWWYDGGALVERPVCPAPAEVSPGVFEVANCPVGAVASVLDVEAGDLLAELPEASGRIEMTFPDPAVYRITVSAAWPYRDSVTEVEVWP